MKHFFLILNLYCLAAFSQVGPPDLRCLQVLPNGDVKLSWLAPSDPGFLFSSYDIYYSQAAAGPFTVVGNVSSISTTSFTHTGTNATVASVYYFLKTKFNPGGTGVSAPSDTLKSIFLNLFNTAGAPDVKIVYNNIHQPALASTVGQYTILKEYPAASWNNFATVNTTNYADTISVCQASINYQVSLPDNSGCISTSNIQGGIFKDKKSPNTPYIDSISVLPNGNTVVAWHIPRDKDIIKYIIVKNIHGVYTPMDTVGGRNNTVYTFTTTEADTNSVKLYVYGVDSCFNNGGFDTIPATMLLKAKYDKCAYKTDLTWNAYRNIPGGILEYRIFSSINGGPFLKIGSTTQTNFTHLNVTPNKNICYFIRVINKTQNITSSSNRNCIYSTQVDAPDFVYIKKASIKDKNTAEITIYLDTTKTANGIDLYRSDDGTTFNALTFLPYNGGPNYSFDDDQITAATNSYYYKAIVRDSCGNPRTVSNISKTILLKVQEDDESIFTKHLSWTSYSGFAGGISGYNIYRVINDVPSSSPIASTGPLVNIYTDDLEDEAPNGSNVEYLIEAVEGISNPYGFMEASRSNTVAVYMEGRIFVPTAFAPNGKNKVWLPVTHFVDKSEYTVSVFNRWGNKIFETHDDTLGWDGKNAANDVYVYLITYKNSLGEYKELKGTFMLYD